VYRQERDFHEEAWSCQAATSLFFESPFFLSPRRGVPSRTAAERNRAVVRTGPIPYHRARRGSTRGRQPLLWGEPAAATPASAFCWRVACFRRGGHPPAPAFPGGETGKGRSNSLRRTLFSSSPLFTRIVPVLFPASALLSAVLSPCFHPHSSRELFGLRCTLAFVISAGAAICRSAFRLAHC
jgi:hypothetical protein